MLKIKDNVDLKELEKYGFSKRDIWYEFYGEDVTTEVSIEDRELYLFSTGAEEIQSMSIPHAVYDLIKDGLVVKVDD